MFIILQGREDKKEELLDMILRRIRPILSEELTLESVYDITELAHAAGRVQEKAGKLVVEGAVARGNEWIFKDKEFLDNHSLLVHDRNKLRAIVLPCVGDVLLSGGVLKPGKKKKKDAATGYHPEGQYGRRYWIPSRRTIRTPLLDTIPKDNTDYWIPSRRTIRITGYHPEGQYGCRYCRC